MDCHDYPGVRIAKICQKNAGSDFVDSWRFSYRGMQLDLVGRLLWTAIECYSLGCPVFHHILASIPTKKATTLPRSRNASPQYNSYSFPSDTLCIYTSRPRSAQYFNRRTSTNVAYRLGLCRVLSPVF